MKKFLAILMAALMVLSCTAGLAETTVAPAREVYAYLTLDRDFIQSYVAGSMGEGSDTIASLVLDLIEKSAVDVVATNGFVTGAVVAGDDDVPLCNFSVVTLEDSVAVTSSLFPNYALRVKAEEVEQLIQQYSNVSLGGQQISPEELEQLLTGLAGSVEGYAADLSAYLETLGEKVEVSEDGTHMSLALTTNEAADVVEIIANRLANDEPVKDLLNKMLADQEMTAEQFIEQMKAAVAQLRAGEAQQLASIDVYNQEDGSVYVEVDLAGKALLTFSTGVTDNGENEVNIYIVTCKEGTEDWQSVYDAVIAGEDTENVVLYISAQLIKPTASLIGESRYSRVYSKSIRLCHLVRIESPVHSLIQSLLRYIDCCRIDPGYVEALRRRYGCYAVHPALLIYRGKRHILLTGCGYIAVDLISEHEHMVLLRKLADSAQGIRIPYLSARVLRIAEKEHGR